MQEVVITEQSVMVMEKWDVDISTVMSISLVKRLCTTRLEMCLETESESDKKLLLVIGKYINSNIIKLRETSKAQDTAAIKKLMVRRWCNGHWMVKTLEILQWTIRSQVL